MMIVLRYRTQDKMHNHIRYLLAPECVAEANLKLGLGGKNTAWNIKSQSLSVRRTVTLSQGGVCSADSHQYCCPLWPTAERWLTENWVWVTGTGAGSWGSGGCNIHTHTHQRTHEVQIDRLLSQGYWPQFRFVGLMKSNLQHQQRGLINILLRSNSSYLFPL